jgi:predicted ATP-binding protein involved in virulence
MYIKSATFENIKAFSDVTFNFGHKGIYAGWNVLVGGNASGKSTILKGIALCIAGPEMGRTLISNNTEGWISKGNLKGSIKTEIQWDHSLDKFRRKGGLANDSFEAAVRWSKDREEDTPIFRGIDRYTNKRTRIITADRGPWDTNAEGWFCAGYGPMRRLTGSSTEAVRYSIGGGVVSRLVTLFREDAALSESEEWLKKLHSRVLERNGEASQHKTLLEGVQSFLNAGLLPHDLQISKVTVDHVLLRNAEELELPMRDLSDGCRSVYAFILDLIHSFFEVYGTEGLFQKNDDGYTFVDKPGVVLIDEIEAHLHPTWQQVLPDWLKTRFPKVQFIVTTHSPIIAQAADPDGIYVLPLQNESERQPRRLEKHEYEKIVLRQAEKTLLGEAFGLKTTYSKRANQLIDEWKRLNAKNKAGADLTAKELKELKALENQMELIFEPGEILK